MGDRFPPDAMLLAAGLGTRLRPLTDTLPKPLIKVAGMPLIDRVIAAAEAEGISRFVVNTHHLADPLEAHLVAARAVPGRSIRISPERDRLLDTGGGVKQALTLLEGDPILVMNTDSFWRPGSDTPIARLMARRAQTSADFVILCAHVRNAIGFSRRSHDFCLAPDGRITPDFGAPVIFAGVSLLSRRIFDATPEAPFSLYRLMEAAMAEERLHGIALATEWLHVGDGAGLAAAEARLAVPS